MSPLNQEPEALAWAVQRSGLTQREIAAQVKCSPGLLSEIIKGTRNARQPLLEELAAILNCPVVVLESKRTSA